MMSETSPQETEMTWRVALEGPDLAALAHWVAQKVWRDAPPSRVVVDLRERPAAADWLEHWEPLAKKSLAVYWEAGTHEKPGQEPPNQGAVVVYPRRVVSARFRFPRRVSDVLSWLAEAPFEVASFGSAYEDWDEIDPDYSPPGFSGNHYPLGWGCAFKGEGHRRLVSRRWLRYGPWKLWQGAGDLSVVQFHDLEIDAAAALAQAKPGHLRMGISDSGGFLQKGHVYENSPKGIYSPAERMLRIVVTGRDLTPVELLDACAARQDQALGPDQPLERVGYVFFDPAAARRHLYELWLRELECYALVDGKEVRLDEDYRPTPTPPDWALKL